MSVLASQRVKARLLDEADEFVITPILDWDRQVRAGSVDLRLDSEFLVTTRTQFASVDPSRREQIAARTWQFQRSVSIPYGEDFVLHPNELVLASTLEYLSFPKNLMAYVIGRSSWGRLGLIIATATQVNPGFKGTLTLELVNAGNVPIHLYPGVRIAQLVIHEVEPDEVVHYQDKYTLQVGPAPSRVQDDKELQYLRSPRWRSVVGIVGHKGSGKEVLIRYLVDKEAYEYFSLSHVVRDLYGREVGGEPTREALQRFGDDLRRKKGGAFIAKELLRRMLGTRRLTRSSRVLIDGIRNRHEVWLLSKIDNFHLVGVTCTEALIKENLRERGILISDDEYSGLLEQKTGGSREAPDSAAARLLLAEKMTAEEVQRMFDRNSGNSEALGQDVAYCLQLATTTLENRGDEVSLVAEFKVAFFGS